MKNCVVCNNILQGVQRKFCSNTCKQKEHCHKEEHHSKNTISNVFKLVGDTLEKSNEAKWMNSEKPLEMVTLSQALKAFKEGAETSG